MIHYILFKNKKYEYTLEPKGEDMFYFSCAAAGIDQLFYKADIPELLVDLPQWILDNETAKSKSTTLRFRVNVDDKKKIEERARENGYLNISRYIRDKVTA